jgi:tRNA(adenine34) deaminase
MSGPPAPDRDLMARCRRLAAGAAAEGNRAIGALVWLDGEVLGESGEKCPAGPVPFAHAELLAIQWAVRRSGRRRLPEAILYSTHELCLMCSYAIRATQIARVVVEAPTPDVGGATSRLPVLTSREVPGWGDPPRIDWLEVA